MNDANRSFLRKTILLYLRMLTVCLMLATRSYGAINMLLPHALYCAHTQVKQSHRIL